MIAGESTGRSRVLSFTKTWIANFVMHGLKQTEQSDLFYAEEYNWALPSMCYSSITNRSYML